MKALSQDEIEKQFTKLPLEWSLLAGTKLERNYKFEDFKSALDFVNQVGKIAEKLNHHPDIQLTYGKVDLMVTTHSVGGLTDKDFEFAQEIAKIED